MTEGRRAAVDRWSSLPPGPIKQHTQAPRIFPLLVGDVVDLPAAVFPDQGVVQRHGLGVLEHHLDPGRVIDDDRLADFDVCGFAVIACDDRVEIDGAGAAGFGVVEVGLEAGVQLVGEERG
jgi:hypothetical protein